MEAINTLYYYVAATAALRMRRLRARGGEKGVMTTTEITGWVVAALVIVGIAVVAIRAVVQRNIDAMNTP
ncbi:MAG: hypothetical protein ABJD68_17965 [Nakamurella sp.]